MWTKEKQDAYNKKYRLENKEKIRQIHLDYYAKNREKRIENSRNWVLQNKERAKETRRLYRNTKFGKLKSIKSSANNRKIGFDLTDEEAFHIMGKPCGYCGKEGELGIDRIDSNLSYSKENCVSCCSMCNYMKKDFNQSDFIKQCKKIASRF